MIHCLWAFKQEAPLKTASSTVSDVRSSITLPEIGTTDKFPSTKLNAAVEIVGKILKENDGMPLDSGKHKVIVHCNWTNMFEIIEHVSDLMILRIRY